MKRAFQIAAALVVLLMAGQPVLDAATCEMGMAASPATCPMGMSEMGPDCPMAGGMPAECLARCLSCAATRDMVLPAAAARPKAITAKVPVRADVVARIGSPAPRLRTLVVTVSNPPPPYLLNRELRI